MGVAICEIYEDVRTAIDSTVRPGNTTQYTAGDLIANSATAGSVVPLVFQASGFGMGRGVIRRALLYRDRTEATLASFRLHLFTTAPVSAAGDNEAFAVTTSQHHLISIDFDQTTGGFVGTADLIKAGTLTADVNFDLRLNGPNERRLYGLLEARDAYTPASAEFFEVTLEMATAK